MITRSKTVTGAEGRTWTVRRTMMWSLPAGEDVEFEHDVDGGRSAAILILSALFVLWVALVLWFPDQVHIPWWLYLIAVVVIGFFPVRWVLRRPWELLAQTPGGYDLPAEHWVGTVRGAGKARDEMNVVVRSIRTRGTPDTADGLLQLVD